MKLRKYISKVRPFHGGVYLESQVGPVVFQIAHRGKVPWLTFGNDISIEPWYDLPVLNSAPFVRVWRDPYWR